MDFLISLKLSIPWYGSRPLDRGFSNVDGSPATEEASVFRRFGSFPLKGASSVASPSS